MKDGGDLDQSCYIMKKAKDILIQIGKQTVRKKREVKGNSKVFG